MNGLSSDRFWARVEADSPERLRQQIEFLLEIDRLKGVLRQTLVSDGSRRENSAEHSWHLPLMALVLSEHAGEDLDLPRIVEMLLIHDIVEIDAGDTFCYDEEAGGSQSEREQIAAKRLFGMLPPAQRERFEARWSEFEARETPEARFAAAVDRLQPLLLNYVNDGFTWQKHGVVSEQVRTRNAKIGDSSPALWSLALAVIEDAKERGFLE